ncbi:uncharacterized protein PITG_17880 [Phytophthora infestans T30-4]|uniref:Uncharacterized protein n=1 Tax=Phytophthora infestans (strain T30-4) TaxID=403677 RepID=D0NWX3_PHYIT|nr:uncharacterized protein PITG_17880 [Phytophthora infestans T30-4]EEY67560.1 hypothetical protein PITG_17880 [Phytophthora infestans T30-4]|eukprot:XP_002896419.1 hypothetical protein PITG_17880 [Phytophthora infestans T30-4]
MENNPPVTNPTSPLHPHSAFTKRKKKSSIYILYISGRGNLHDVTITRITTKLYLKNQQLVVATSDVFGWVVGRKVAMDADAVEATLMALAGDLRKLHVALLVKT